MKMIVPGNRPILALTLLPVFLAACGGGGGDDNDTNRQPVDPPRPVATAPAAAPATITRLTPQQTTIYRFDRPKTGSRRIDP